MKSIGDLIKQARLAVDLSQKQLAANSGVQRTTLNRIENGSVAPATATLQKIGDTLSSCSELQERIEALEEWDDRRLDILTGNFA